ncbi:hypothetical protein SSTU70S_01590 [Stutzerimonas stutzeri]
MALTTYGLITAGARPMRTSDRQNSASRAPMAMSQQAISPTSPVAAFTSGGPARKMVAWLRTMMVSSAIAGT